MLAELWHRSPLASSGSHRARRTAAHKI